jgi:hypothetical protein
MDDELESPNPQMKLITQIPNLRASAKSADNFSKPAPTPPFSCAVDPKLLHRADSFRKASVNKVFSARQAALISLVALSCSPTVHRRVLGTTLFTRFRCRFNDLLYAVHSSLKELSRTAVIARKLSSGSRMIPGDWGKVGPGWLARLLSNRSASSDGWRQDSPVPLARSRVSVNAKLGTRRRGAIRNRSESSQVAQDSFEPE